MAFRDDPRFQKRVRRRLNIDPSQSAIVDTGDIAAGFAAEQEGRQIQAGAEASRRDLRGRSFEEGKRATSASEALTRDRAGFRQEQGRIATGASVVGLGVTALGGLADIKDANERVAFIDDMILRMRDEGNEIEANNLELIKIIERYKS